MEILYWNIEIIFRSHTDFCLLALDIGFSKKSLICLSHGRAMFGAGGQRVDDLQMMLYCSSLFFIVFLSFPYCSLCMGLSSVAKAAGFA